MNTYPITVKSNEHVVFTEPVHCAKVSTCIRMPAQTTEPVAKHHDIKKLAPHTPSASNTSENANIAEIVKEIGKQYLSEEPKPIIIVGKPKTCNETVYTYYDMDIIKRDLPLMVEKTNNKNDYFISKKEAPIEIMGLSKGNTVDLYVMAGKGSIAFNGKTYKSETQTPVVFACNIKLANCIGSEEFAKQQLEVICDNLGYHFFWIDKPAKLIHVHGQIAEF